MCRIGQEAPSARGPRSGYIFSENRRPVRSHPRRPGTAFGSDKTAVWRHGHHPAGNGRLDQEAWLLRSAPRPVSHGRGPDFDTDFTGRKAVRTCQGLRSFETNAVRETNSFVRRSIVPAWRPRRRALWTATRLHTHRRHDGSGGCDIIESLMLRDRLFASRAAPPGVPGHVQENTFSAAPSAWGFIRPVGDIEPAPASSRSRSGSALLRRDLARRCSRTGGGFSASPAARL